MFTLKKSREPAERAHVARLRKVPSKGASTALSRLVVFCCAHSAAASPPSHSGVRPCRRIAGTTKKGTSMTTRKQVTVFLENKPGRVDHLVFKPVIEPGKPDQNCPDFRAAAFPAFRG